VRLIIDVVTARRMKYLIGALWIVVTMLLGPLSGKLTSVEKNDSKSWLPSTAESVKVLDLQRNLSSSDTLPAVVVYERTGGLTDEDRRNIAADAQRFPQAVHLVGPVVGPIPSDDGKAEQVIVPLDLGNGGWKRAAAMVDELRKVIGPRQAGLSIHVAGPAGNGADSSKVFSGLDGTLLYGTLGIVFLILLLVYRSPTLWLLPMVSTGVALSCAQAAIYFMTKHTGLTVNAQSSSILTVLVFGAGTDYALLLIARYREELRRHADRHEAMAVALHRAGPAIIASAATVAISMLCLQLAYTNSTKGLGPVLAIGIVVGLVANVTLLPALLVIVGRWIFWPNRPQHGLAEPRASRLWPRIGQMIVRAPRATWIGTAGILAVMAVGLIQLDATGLTDKESFRTRPDSVVGEEVLARHFAVDSANPIVVVSRATSATQVRSALGAIDGIDPATVGQPIFRNGYAYLEANLTDPADSQAAFDTVDRARKRLHAIGDAKARIGGNSAVNLDIQRAAQHDRNVILPIIVVVVFIVLGLLLRAIVAPLVLIATVVLSFAAALGISAVIFRHAFGFGGADASLPLFVFVFLVALGIDYNIFLMTRVREEAMQAGARKGALVGLTATGSVITSAGVVLAGTFAVLAVLPLTAFAEMGFAIALGVLLDTIVVRSVLVTALNLDIGRHMWWPSQLARLADEVFEANRKQPPFVGTDSTAR
jgi:RND superfamily putative drug exporter